MPSRNGLTLGASEAGPRANIPAEPRTKLAAPAGRQLTVLCASVPCAALARAQQSPVLVRQQIGVSQISIAVKDWSMSVQPPSAHPMVVGDQNDDELQPLVD